MVFNGPSGAKWVHLSPLSVAMKAFFDSLSIDRGVVGAFLGCFEIVSIITLPFFPHGATEKVCSNNLWLIVL